MENEFIRLLETYSNEIKNKFHIKEIGIFGSQIKNKARKKSDVDVLVEFEEGYKTFDNYMELKFFLEKIFKKKVDLVLKNAIKERLKPYILSEVIYV